MSPFMMLQVICLSMGVGFGFRIGWDMVPFASNVLAHVIAFPVWLFQLAVFHFRRYPRSEKEMHR